MKDNKHKKSDYWLKHYYVIEPLVDGPQMLAYRKDTMTDGKLKIKYNMDDVDRIIISNN